MKWGQQTKKSLGLLVVFGFVLTGTYNAVVINSESSIDSREMRFVKRIDEVYGVVTPGRMVATSTVIKKLDREELKADPIVQVVSKLDAAPAIAQEEVKEEVQAEAAVQEELDLGLVEVINPKKWAQGLNSSQFSGNLVTNNGTIENLSVSLPNGEGISVEFSDMTGNVFEYDLDGEVYSGMMYQVDQNSYMVTLTNGPLEGTRLKFSQAAAPQENYQQEVQPEVAQEQQPVEAGNFGGEQPQQEYQEQLPQDQISQYDQEMQNQTMQAQSFNMDQPQTF